MILFIIILCKIRLSLSPININDLGVFVITFLHNFQNFVQSTLSLWTPRYNGCSDDVDSS